MTTFRLLLSWALCTCASEAEPMGVRSNRLKTCRNGLPIFWLMIFSACVALKVEPHLEAARGYARLYQGAYPLSRNNLTKLDKNWAQLMKCLQNTIRFGLLLRTISCQRPKNVTEAC